jgi:hypothetical protein
MHYRYRAVDRYVYTTEVAAQVSVKFGFGQASKAVSNTVEIVFAVNGWQS